MLAENGMIIQVINTEKPRPELRPKVRKSGLVQRHCSWLLIRLRVIRHGARELRRKNTLLRVTRKPPPKRSLEVRSELLSEKTWRAKKKLNMLTNILT